MWRRSAVPVLIPVSRSWRGILPASARGNSASSASTLPHTAVTAVLRRPASEPSPYSRSRSRSAPASLFAQIEHIEHRLLGKELESANELLISRVDIQLPQRTVLFEQRLTLLQTQIRDRARDS